MTLNVISNFWYNHVSQLETAGNEPSPHTLLEGANADTIKNSAEVLYPTLDGDTVVLPESPKRADGSPFDLNSGATPTEAEFLSWHSAHQMEFLRKQTLQTTSSTPPIEYYSFALSSSLEMAFVRKEATTPILTSALNKSNLPYLDNADKQVILDLPTYASRLAPRLGLDASTDSANLVAIRTAAIDSVIADINALQNRSYLFLDKTYQTSMPSEGLAAFTDQLANLKTRVQQGILFTNDGDLQDKIKAIETRANRAADFFHVKDTDHQFSKKFAPSDSNTEFHFIDRVSLDGNATIKSGYENFISNEIRLRDLDNQKLSLSLNISNGNLDVPSLIFLFQQYANLETEIHVSIETEEIKQRNALLKDYAKMQNLVAETTKGFGTDSEEKKAILSSEETNGYRYTDLTKSEIDTAMMFTQNIANFESVNNPYSGHPLERLNNIDRPLQEIFSGVDDSRQPVKYLKTVWDSYGTQLADAVTLLNQNTQITTNEISSLNSRKNRHFSLANDSLRKLNDIVLNIARS